MEDELDDEEKSRTCDICEKTFANTEELNDHLPQHQFQDENRCDEGHPFSGQKTQHDLQSFNDPLSLGSLECPPTKVAQTLTDFQSPAISDKSNISSPTTKSNLCLPESELNSSNEIMKEEQEQNLKETLDNVKDEAQWDILEVKMEPEEENMKEYNSSVNIPKQKYNKLKKFEGKLFRF